MTAPLSRKGQIAFLTLAGSMVFGLVGSVRWAPLDPTWPGNPYLIQALTLANLAFSLALAFWLSYLCIWFLCTPRAPFQWMKPLTLSIAAAPWFMSVLYGFQALSRYGDPDNDSLMHGWLTDTSPTLWLATEACWALAWSLFWAWDTVRRGRRT